MCLLLHRFASGDRLCYLAFGVGFVAIDTVWRDGLRCLRGPRGLRIAS
jgi:hypothetical protein